MYYGFELLTLTLLQNLHLLRASKFDGVCTYLKNTEPNVYIFIYIRIYNRLFFFFLLFSEPPPTTPAADDEDDSKVAGNQVQGGEAPPRRPNGVRSRPQNGK